MFNIVFNLYLYILDTPETSCQESDSDLVVSPSQTGPRGWPCDTDGAGGWVRARPSPSLLGRRSRPTGRSQIPLEMSPVPLTLMFPECWPDQDRILTKSGKNVVPHGVQGWHALPRVPPVRTRSHALSLRVCFRLPFGKVPSVCKVPSTFIFLYCFELPRQPFAQKQ